MTPLQISRLLERTLGRQSKRSNENVLNKILRSEQKVSRDAHKEKSWKALKKDATKGENALVEYGAPLLNLFGPLGMIANMAIQQYDVHERTKNSDANIKRFEKHFGESDVTKNYKEALKKQGDAAQLQEFGTNLLGNLIAPVGPTDEFKKMSWGDKLKSVIGKGPEGMESEFWKGGVDYADTFKNFDKKLGLDPGYLLGKFNELPKWTQKGAKNPLITNLLRKMGGF